VQYAIKLITIGA
jgi:hypothetical protein